MAAFDHIRDMNDVALKPRLLQSLLKQVPDESPNVPFRDPSVISSIVSFLKTHHLLAVHSSDLKIASAWDSAFDAWLSRLLSLARTDLPDKCWAGICLLGVTCIECSSERFLSSYLEWFNVLFSKIQSSGASQLVRIASCAAVSDLLTRLGGFSNLKKDGNSLAGKLVVPVLEMLSEDVAEAVLDVAAQLLLTILNYFPSSVHRHHDNVESVIVSRIMSENCSANWLEKLSFCLASLPKSRGDEDTWSLMMQKVILSVSALLNNVLEGLEEDSRRGEAVALLVPPGKDPPPSLGGEMMTGMALRIGERTQKSLIASISSLMQCCCIMLTNSYPVQVKVPVCPLLAMIRRVLMVSGSLPEMLRPFTTAMQQELVCLHLPVLHLNVLEVLAAVVEGLHSQLLPHAADITWLLLKFFKTCCLPELRTKVYSIIRVLLVSMGAGMALYISEEIIENGSVDLKFDDCTHDGASTEGQSFVEVSVQHHRKKRKHGAPTGLSLEQQTSLCTEVKDCQASVALKVAALETLEALLLMGGALKSDNWRRRIDDLLIEVATLACKEGRVPAERLFQCKETKDVSWEYFQLVALRALLASLLSPTGYRPPYLSRSLELFHKGMQNAGTKVAEFCAQGLLALEVLVHPRALPLIHTPLPKEYSYSLESTNFANPKHPDGIPRTSRSIPHDVYDFLNDIYMEDPAVDAPKETQHDGQIFDSSKNRIHNEPKIVNSTPNKVIPMECDACLEPPGLNESNEHNEELNRTHPAISNPVDAGAENTKSDANVFIPSGSGEPGPVARAIDSTSEVEHGVSPIAGKNATWEISMNKDDDCLSDSFPDIVDGDPDSCSEKD